ncbi:MAG: hypothetical protein ABIN83_00965 [Sphingomicrobium sp.]
MRPRLFVCAALALVPSSAGAQTSPVAPPNCSAHGYRALDFWVGSWEVFDTAGNTRIASSRIESIMQGCAIRESFVSRKAPGGPYEGTSYSSLDRKDGHWHQMYVDTRGSVTWYEGSVEGGAMVMTAPGRGGSTQRMVYSRRADGSVTQIGTVSTDGGKSWQPGYDYTYRPASR